MPFRFAQWGAHGRLFSKWDQPELKPNWFDIEHGRFSWPVGRGPKNCPCPVFGFAAKEMVAEKSFIFRISKGEFLKLELSSRRRGKGRQKVSVGHFWAKAVGASSLEIHSIQWCIVSRRGNGPKLSRDFLKLSSSSFLSFSVLFLLYFQIRKRERDWFSEMLLTRACDTNPSRMYAENFFEQRIKKISKKWNRRRSPTLIDRIILDG